MVLNNFRYRKTKTVAFFSEANIVSLNFLEKLLANFCDVVIISKAPELWAAKTIHLKDNENVKIYSWEIAKLLIVKGLFEKISYFFLQPGEERKFFLSKDLEDYVASIFKDFAKILAGSQKILLALPLGYVNFLNDNKFTGFFSVHKNIEITLVGEVYGPRMSFWKNSLLSTILYQAAKGGPIYIPAAQINIYPIYIGEVVESLYENLFGISTDGQVNILSNCYSVQDFYQEIIKEYPNLSYIKKIETLENYKEYEYQNLDTELFKDKKDDLGIRTTIDWLRDNKQEFTKEPKARKIMSKFLVKGEFPEIQVKSPFSFKYFLLPCIVFVLWFFFVPFIAVFISTLSLNLAYKNLENKNLKNVQFFLSTATLTSSLSEEIAASTAKIPLLGIPMDTLEDAAILLKRTSLIGKKSIAVYQDMSQLVVNLLSSQDYDLVKLSKNINLGFQSLYRETSFLESDLNSMSQFVNNIFPYSSKVKELRRYLLLASELSENLPDLLGENKPKTYMFLFQNNMELRPTGGFIGSFALVVLNKGKLIDTNILDVYSADGQLKGHVEPPQPIKDYLGEANWYLRDSNWDPNFPVTAQRVEWFLDKELDKSVDGVISLDLEVVKLLLKALGPIRLADFNDEVNSGNVYEKTQLQVESNFFPGSRKKANFLASLSREIVNEITKSEKGDYLEMFKLILASLKTRHIQIFIHQAKVQKTLALAGWDGSFNLPSCESNCVVNWLSAIDANLGVNKANYYLDRDYKLTTNIKNGFIENKLTVNFHNRSQEVVDFSSRYKSFFRVFAPLGSFFEKVKVKSLLKEEDIDPQIKEVNGIKEVGVPIEIMPGESKSLTFLWRLSHNLKFEEKGKVIFFWRKQAGTFSDPATLNFLWPSDLRIVTKPPFSLTEGQNLGYNTDLLQDISSEISW